MNEITCIKSKCLKYPVFRHKTKLDCEVISEWLNSLECKSKTKLDCEVISEWLKYPDTKNYNYEQIRVTSKLKNSKGHQFRKAFPKTHTVVGKGFIISYYIKVSDLE
jgi:hypothetical protein